MGKGIGLRLSATIAALILVAAAPASADVTTQAYVTKPGPSSYCYLEGWGTFRTGNDIYGSGQINCSPNPLVGVFEFSVNVERHRFFGWETVKTVDACCIDDAGGFMYRQVTYNCSGTGTHDFRIRVSGNKTLQQPNHTHLYTPAINASC